MIKREKLRNEKTANSLSELQHLFKKKPGVMINTGVIRETDIVTLDNLSTVVMKEARTNAPQIFITDVTMNV